MKHPLLETMHSLQRSVDRIGEMGSLCADIDIATEEIERIEARLEEAIVAGGDVTRLEARLEVVRAEREAAQRARDDIYDALLAEAHAADAGRTAPACL